MIGLVILAAANMPPLLEEAARALAAGRPHQARGMITLAISRGASGKPVERLLADLAFTSRDWRRALGAYEQLLAGQQEDPLLAERAGIAALHLGDLPRAERLLARATANPNASWRAWNARAALADMAGNWNLADEAYEKALSFEPRRAEVLNNIGWSRLLRGDWEAAIEPLEQSAQLSPANARIAANLDLARSALSEELPKRRGGESGSDWAARLNDAGVAAVRQGDRSKAVAAFAQALEASHKWFLRAANNLDALETAR